MSQFQHEYMWQRSKTPKQSVPSDFLLTQKCLIIPKLFPIKIHNSGSITVKWNKTVQAGLILMRLCFPCETLIEHWMINDTHQTGDGDGRPVGPAHEEPFQDNLVEGSVWATCQEPVQLQAPHSVKPVQHFHYIQHNKSLPIERHYYTQNTLFLTLTRSLR